MFVCNMWTCKPSKVRIKEGIKGTWVRQAKSPSAAAEGRADLTAHGSRVCDTLIAVSLIADILCCNVCC